ncbi:unnamed protein product, partial [Chrysoparadoxa australica]
MPKKRKAPEWQKGVASFFKPASGQPGASSAGTTQRKAKSRKAVFGTNVVGLGLQGPPPDTTSASDKLTLVREPTNEVD